MVGGRLQRTSHSSVEILLPTFFFDFVGPVAARPNGAAVEVALSFEDYAVFEVERGAYYLLRKYAPKSELYPECVKHRTRIDQVLAAVTATIQPHKMAFFRPLMNEKRKPTSEEVASFEENVLKGFENLIGDGKFAVGDQFTLADICLFSSMVGIFEMGFIDKAKYSKLCSYYERVLPEITGYDDIYKPVLAAMQEHWLKAK